MRRRFLRSLLLLLGLIGLGCGSKSETATDEVALSPDALALREAIGDNICIESMLEVDRNVDEGKGVRASEILTDATAPCLEGLQTRLQEAAVATPSGARAKSRLIRAIEKRRSAVSQYSEVLSHGPGEDLPLVRAMESHRKAEQFFSEAMNALEVL